MYRVVQCEFIRLPTMVQKWTMWIFYCYLKILGTVVIFFTSSLDKYTVLLDFVCGRMKMFINYLKQYFTYLEPCSTKRRSIRFAKFIFASQIYTFCICVLHRCGVYANLCLKKIIRLRLLQCFNPLCTSSTVKHGIACSFTITVFSAK